MRTARVAVVFVRLGATAFGGLGAALVLIDRELVEARRWVTAGDVRDALAFTKPLPGSTVVQVAAFLGFRVGGFRAAAAATVAFLAPSAALMMLAAAAVTGLPDAAWVDGLLSGLQVAVVGLLINTTWRLARSEALTVALRVTLLASFALGFVVNAALLVLVAGILGLLWQRRRDA